MQSSTLLLLLLLLLLRPCPYTDVMLRLQHVAGGRFSGCRSVGGETERREGRNKRKRKKGRSEEKREELVGGMMAGGGGRGRHCHRLHDKVSEHVVASKTLRVCSTCAYNTTCCCAHA